MLITRFDGSLALLEARCWPSEAAKVYEPFNSTLSNMQDDYLRKAAEKGDVGTVNRWIEAGVPADPLRAHHTVSPAPLQMLPIRSAVW